MGVVVNENLEKDLAQIMEDNTGGIMQFLSVRWNTTFSTKFGVSNGVRQGGVISPILFTVYIDELLSRLDLTWVLDVILAIILLEVSVTLMMWLF